MNNRPKTVKDINEYILFENKDEGNIYCIGSIEKDRYIEVKEEQKNAIMKAIKYFDGTNDIEEINEKLKKVEKIDLNINKLYNLLLEAGLLENEQVDLNKNEFERYGFKIASIPLDKLSNLFYFFSKYSKLYLMVLIFAAFFSFPLIPKVLSKLLYFNIYKILDSSVLSLILSLFLTTASVLVHEFSHAIFAKKYGLNPKKMEIVLYLYLNPIAYIKTNGIYTLSKQKRILVWSVGILSNLIIFFVSVIIQNYTTGTVSQVFLLLSYTNLGLVVTNFIPFLPLDGYYILTTLFQLTNLRKKSFGGFKKILKEETFKKKAIYIVYNFISVVILCYIIIVPVVQVIYNFYLAYLRSHNIFDGLNEIWMYLVLVVLVIFSRIIVRKQK
ncbi:metalloprotease [Anaerococcus nagyae]|uniref:Peptidase M50 n=1 Tax=Anaerococcus nagyae TaxID=1755241 RepID=A0A3E2THP0_9FIRM|nr:M50 family metallopeptidase [Anaerococcus nagyae]RGB75944.1 hypothetical protein DXA39_06375 [Anaerococcus nagyae]